MTTMSNLEIERKAMQTRHAFLRSLLLTSGAILVAFGTSAFAAEVTPQRLVNADKEPQNWLMNHRTYDGQRFSPLDKINKGNVRGLKIAYAVPLAGTKGNEASSRSRVGDY
jgi:alcohol dehydrogenase (cytochrome c)